MGRNGNLGPKTNPDIEKGPPRGGESITRGEKGPSLREEVL